MAKPPKWEDNSHDPDGYAPGMNADRTLDIVPLAEWEKRAAELAETERVWDLAVLLAEMDLDAMTPEELDEIIAGLGG